MGSQRHDIYYALEAFADHCDRYPLDRRPTYWAQYVDIWGDPVGEFGIPNPTAVDATKHKTDKSVFALLTPWLAIPTMAEAWVVVDRLEWLWVLCVKANVRGYFSPVWEIRYRMEDDGSLTPSEPTPIAMPELIGASVAAAMKARNEQQLWDVAYTVDSLVPVIEGLLGR